MSSDKPGDGSDEAFGANLRFLRERKEMSQPELARLMAERGWPWHQSTVYRTESGRQPLRFREAVDLAHILGVTLDRLAWAGPEVTIVSLVSATHGRLRLGWREAADSVGRLHAARDAAERTVAEYGGSEYRRARDAARGLDDELKDATLDTALAEAQAMWERIQRGEF